MYSKNKSDGFLVLTCSVDIQWRRSLSRKCPVTGCFDRDGQTHIIFCGQWSCPTCSQRLANAWARRARLIFDRDENGVEDECFFLTLTLGSGVHSTADAYSLLHRLWDTTRKNFQRNNKKFSYIAFVEGQPHRRHMPHFHILTTELPPSRRNKSGFPTKRGLHDWAHSLGWGFMAELLIVSGPEASAYVAKYASKVSPSTPKGFRRVRVSRDWPKEADRGSSGWIVPARDEDVAHFIMRVAEITGFDPADLWPKWSEVNSEIISRHLDHKPKE